MHKYDVIIVGAGTAGLSARKEVEKLTSNYLVVDGGPLGTTCARVGCMPSKVLIQVANDFFRRKKFPSIGIQGSEHLFADTRLVMRHVRALRDRFVRGVLAGHESWKDKLVKSKACFVDSNTLALGSERATADRFILAVGSRPILPPQWQLLKDDLIDTDSFFELEELPKSMGVVGLGVIGIELGLALSRLGVNTIGISTNRAIGGASDPVIQDYIYRSFQQEMPLYLNGGELVKNSTGGLRLSVEGKSYEVEKALIAVGRRSNLDQIGITKLGVTLNGAGVPEIDRNTMQIRELPHVFVPGDANADRPILHEAADEGYIAGHNAVSPSSCFRRRTWLGIAFSEPNIASVGLLYKQLTEQNHSFVTGKVSFEGQGRSIVKLKEQGLLHVYVDQQSGEILGSEIFGPDAEHLAHLLAWAISLKMTVFEALKMPFYHPVIEEGLRTALRDAAKQVQAINGAELGSEIFRCAETPIR